MNTLHKGDNDDNGTHSVHLQIFLYISVPHPSQSHFRLYKHKPTLFLSLAVCPPVAG